MERPAESEKVSQKKDEHKKRERRGEDLLKEREQETKQREELNQKVNVLQEKPNRIGNGKEE